MHGEHILRIRYITLEVSSRLLVLLVDLLLVEHVVELLRTRLYLTRPNNFRQVHLLAALVDPINLRVVLLSLLVQILILLAFKQRALSLVFSALQINPIRRSILLVHLLLKLFKFHLVHYLVSRIIWTTMAIYRAQHSLRLVNVQFTIHVKNLVLNRVGVVRLLPIQPTTQSCLACSLSELIGEHVPAPLVLGDYLKIFINIGFAGLAIEQPFFCLLRVKSFLIFNVINVGKVSLVHNLSHCVLLVIHVFYLEP